MQNKKVFLSYCSADAIIADSIEHAIQSKMGPQVSISRYTRDVGYRESFKAFMNSISVHDYVLTIVSDRYLKSMACLYEVGEVIKNHDFKDRMLFVVLTPADQKYYIGATYNVSADIYTVEGRLQYLLYWQEVYEDLRKNIVNIKSLEAKIPFLEELKRIKKIVDYDINPFMEYLADAKGISFSQLYERGYEDILDAIIPFKEHLVMHEGFHYDSSTDHRGITTITNTGSVNIVIDYTSYLSTFPSPDSIVIAPTQSIGFLPSEDIDSINPQNRESQGSRS